MSDRIERAARAIEDVYATAETVVGDPHSANFKSEAKTALLSAIGRHGDARKIAIRFRDSGTPGEVTITFHDRATRRTIAHPEMLADALGF